MNIKKTKKIIRECHLLNPKWNRLFIIMCQKVEIFTAMTCQKGSPHKIVNWPGLHSGLISKRVKTAFQLYS